jgi:hypothetical protein
MIGVVFSFGSETIEVRVVDQTVLFRSSTFAQWADISGIRLNREGVIKEFPELKIREDWREEAIKRFKEKIKKMDSEKEIVKYIMEDLSKYGYRAMYMQKSGFRPVKLN